MTSFLDAFTTAASKPITKAIVWPETIPQSHPIREVGIHVRFWPAMVAAFVNQEITGHPTNPDKPTEVYDWYNTLYWYVIASSACNAEGEPVFTAEWPKIWSDYVVANSPPVVPDTSAAKATYTDDGVLVTPPPDYTIIGEWLKKTYDTKPGQLIMMPIWDAAMAYNGWELTLGKKSEAIATSGPSGDTV